MIGNFGFLGMLLVTKYLSSSMNSFKGMMGRESSRRIKARITSFMEKFFLKRQKYSESKEWIKSTTSQHLRACYLRSGSYQSFQGAKQKNKGAYFCSLTIRVQSQYCHLRALQFRQVPSLPWLSNASSEEDAVCTGDLAVSSSPFCYQQINNWLHFIHLISIQLLQTLSQTMQR